MEPILCRNSLMKWRFQVLFMVMEIVLRPSCCVKCSINWVTDSQDRQRFGAKFGTWSQKVKVDGILLEVWLFEVNKYTTHIDRKQIYLDDCHSALKDLKNAMLYHISPKVTSGCIWRHNEGNTLSICVSFEFRGCPQKQGWCKDMLKMQSQLSPVSCAMWRYCRHLVATRHSR